MRVLKHGLLKIAKSDEVEKWKFTLVIRNMEVVDKHRNEKHSFKLRVWWRYNIDTAKAFHCHESEEVYLQACLSPETRQEATEMHNIVHMGYEDVVRYLQERYGIIIDVEKLKHRLNYMKNKNSTRDGGFLLFSLLVCLARA